MRRLRGCAVAVPILLLAAACNEPIPGAEKTLAAAEAARAEVAEPPATTATAVAVTSSPPTVPAPTVAAPTTVKGTTTTRPPASTAPRTPPPPAPAPGVHPSTGATVSNATTEAVTTTAAEGSTTVNLKAVREMYMGEKVMVEVTATSSELITSVKIDFGDGHVVTVPQTPRLGLPPQHGLALHSYVYPAAGRYRITATVTLVPGVALAPPGGNPTNLSWFPNGPEHTVAAAANFLQRSDTAPPTYPRLPALLGE